MKSLSVISAFILSLLIAVPVCCCSTEVGQTHNTRSCCHGKTSSNNKKDEPKVCACKTHDEKDKAEVLLIPGGTVRDVVPPDYEFSLAPSTYFTPVVAVINPYIIDDPLVDVLVKYSRWLI